MNTQAQKTKAERINEAKEKLFHFRPLLFSAIFLCLGVVFVRARITEQISWWWLTALLLVAFPLAFCHSKRRALKILIADAVLLLCFLIGALGFFFQTHNFAKTKIYQGEYAVIGTVCERRKTDFGFYVVLSDIQIDGEEGQGKLAAYLPYGYDHEIALANRLLLTGEVTTQTQMRNNFPTYAIEENLRYQMRADGCAVIGKSNNIFLRFRARMEQVVYAGMDETPATVTIATLTGNADVVESGLLENIRHSGVAHIFAVSGLHIGALYAFCLLLFKITPLRKSNKLLRFFLIATALIFYGGVCGFSASVVRALVMCLILYASHLLGIANDSAENLGTAAILVILRSPVTLFTIGFQLSFAACLGIVWLARPLANALCKPKRISPDENTHAPTLKQQIIRKAVLFFAVTLSASIATAPLQLKTFGYVSGWSLLLNCLLVPLISACFPFLLLLVLLSCALPLSASIVTLYVPNVLWSALLLLFETVNFSTFALTGVRLNAAALIPYYGACTFLTDKWNLSKTQKTVYFFLFFLVFVATVYALNV